MAPHRGKINIEEAGDHARELVLLGSAQKAGIFESLAQEKDTASLKRELHADERALNIVLDALCALGYVKKKKDLYVITNKSRSLFLERGKDYAGGFLPHFMNIMRAWLMLPDIIKGAKPQKAQHDIAAFMNAMASIHDEIVEETINHCLKKKKSAKSVLDLGGGPGKYAKAFANRGLEVVLYDLPETIDYVVAAFKLGELKNLSLKKGDFTGSEFESEFPSRSFDIIFMGNICHIYSENENRLLIKRVSSILKKEGMITISDFLRGRSPRAEMFAVNMLANTEGGNTWTEEQYKSWLENAGFYKIEVFDLDKKERQLITAFLE